MQYDPTENPSSLPPVSAPAGFIYTSDDPLGLGQRPKPEFEFPPKYLGGANRPTADDLLRSPGILSDRQIRQLCTDGREMIKPYAPKLQREDERNGTQAEWDALCAANIESGEAARDFLRQRFNNKAITNVRIDPILGLQVREKIVSYGQSSFGYDVRCSDEFKIFTNVNSTVIDPKNFDDSCFVDFKGPKCIIPPNSFALARTVEYFKIPRDLLTVCLGKSTYARCGIIVNVTPFEPDWEGHVTLEFSNTTPLPATIYANEGCAQILFFRNEWGCETSYADRGGKYQGQTGVVVPRM